MIFLPPIVFILAFSISEIITKKRENNPWRFSRSRTFSLRPRIKRNFNTKYEVGVSIL
jgi:hypothetical protein